MFARLVVALALLSTLTCAGSSSTRRYPRRSAGCPLKIFHSPMPEAVLWDDIGPLEVGCYLDEGESICMSRLRTEACKMGGDMIYAVPKRAFRPTERAMVYRGMVAHSRETPKQDEDKPAEAGHADAGAGGAIVPLAPAAAAGGAIVPLPPAAEGAVAAPNDAGADGPI
jgi:hypothetical protein